MWPSMSKEESVQDEGQVVGGQTMPDLVDCDLKYGFYSRYYGNP